MAYVSVKGGATTDPFSRGQLVLTFGGLVVLTTGKTTANTFEAVVLEGEPSNNPGSTLMTGKVALFQRDGSRRFIGTVTIKEE